MIEHFYDSPIFNSPYAYLARQCELIDGLPTNHTHTIQWRYTTDFIASTPKPQKRRKSDGQQISMIFGEKFTEEKGLQYNLTLFI